VSWSWFYPFHYGPFLQDMKNLEILSPTIHFELDAPLSPFQQLLSCLPSSSSYLLPKSMLSGSNSNNNNIINSINNSDVTGSNNNYDDNYNYYADLINNYKNDDTNKNNNNNINFNNNINANKNNNNNINTNNNSSSSSISNNNISNKVITTKNTDTLERSYDWLMNSAESPLIEYYPKYFEIDLNGKKNDYEAVVKLPFIDQLKLIECEEKYCKQHLFVNSKDVERNRVGVVFLFTNNFPVQQNKIEFFTLNKVNAKTLNDGNTENNKNINNNNKNNKDNSAINNKNADIERTVNVFYPTPIHTNLIADVYTVKKNSVHLYIFKPKLTPGVAFKAQLIDGTLLSTTDYPSIDQLQLNDFKKRNAKSNFNNSNKNYNKKNDKLKKNPRTNCYNTDAINNNNAQEVFVMPGIVSSPTYNTNFNNNNNNSSITNTTTNNNNNNLKINDTNNDNNKINYTKNNDMIAGNNMQDLKTNILLHFLVDDATNSFLNAIANQVDVQVPNFTSIFNDNNNNNNANIEFLFRVENFLLNNNIENNELFTKNNEEIVNNLLNYLASFLLPKLCSIFQKVYGVIDAYSFLDSSGNVFIKYDDLTHLMQIEQLLQDRIEKYFKSNVFFTSSTLTATIQNNNYDNNNNNNNNNKKLLFESIMNNFKFEKGIKIGFLKFVNNSDKTSFIQWLNTQLKNLAVYMPNFEINKFELLSTNEQNKSNSTSEEVQKFDFYFSS
jgi:hypothetical protein